MSIHSPEKLYSVKEELIICDSSRRVVFSNGKHDEIVFLREGKAKHVVWKYLEGHKVEDAFSKRLNKLYKDWRKLEEKRKRKGL